MKQHNEIIDDVRLRNANQIIGCSYTRIEILRQLVYETYGNSSIQDATKLNIFVDLSSVLHALYSENNRIVIDNITDISSSIINLCGHYRGFFRNYLGVDTRIFLVNSKNICDINRKFVGDYNATFYQKTVLTQTTKLIDNNMQLLKILCPYLPAIYYIDTQQQFEASVIIAYLIETLNDNNPNLIISHDMYPMQLCSQYKWTSYLYPKKSYRGGILEDTSWMIPVNDKTNFKEVFWKCYCKHRKTAESTIDHLINRISPVNYPLYISLVKFPERGLSNILQSITAIKFIESIVGNQDIKVQSAQFMNDPNFVSVYPVSAIDSRYKAMDVQYMLPFYRNSPEAKQIKLLDLDDITTVNNIVAKYYANNPIDLQKL